jgi:hypothetical protein
MTLSPVTVAVNVTLELTEDGFGLPITVVMLGVAAALS